MYLALMVAKEEKHGNTSNIMIGINQQGYNKLFTQVLTLKNFIVKYLVRINTGIWSSKCLYIFIIFRT